MQHAAPNQIIFWTQNQSWYTVNYIYFVSTSNNLDNQKLYYMYKIIIPFKIKFDNYEIIFWIPKSISQFTISPNDLQKVISNLLQAKLMI